MELACHVREVGHFKELDRFPAHLADIYGRDSLDGEGWFSALSDHFTRVYIGDEFCINRLPAPGRLTEICNFAAGRGLGITFLTPYLTDEGLRKCSALFNHLEKSAPHAEVIVNDWGALLFFRERFPSFQMGIGRLLDKGFKDPRLPDAENIRSISREIGDLLAKSTFDSPEFQKKMLGMGVSRLERDLLPYGIPGENLRLLRNAFYFPFGYVTTGRVCFLASFNQHAVEKFTIPDGCGRICDLLTLELGTDKSSFQLVQGGNTVFYLYPLPALGVLVERAKCDNFRLVYQGLAI